MVRAFGSFPEQRLSPRGGKRMSQIPAVFLKVPYAVDYCGSSCCLFLEECARKAAGEVQKRRRAH